jgi:beta-lactamase superfamily II metal-dependent hydrolase
MLFPGDAQWGTWNSILTDASRSRLLENLTFYKVGHHGSHNATPVSFANRYIKGKVRAMIPYGLGAKWPTIPRQGLIDYLTAQNSPFVRSDSAPPPRRAVFSSHGWRRRALHRYRITGFLIGSTDEHG